MVDGDLWLYTKLGGSQFGLSLFLTLLIVLEISARSVSCFGGFPTHANIHNDKPWFSFYYSIMLCNSLLCSICLWKSYIKVLPIAFCAYLVDLMCILIYMDHIAQFVHWIILSALTYTLSQYFRHSVASLSFFSDPSLSYPLALATVRKMVFPSK